MESREESGRRGKKGRSLNRAVGARGEEEAARYLAKKGFIIVERNCRSPLGEIDIVALDGETVVIVEVKSKSGKNRGTPEDMITSAKRKKLTLLALGYLRARRWRGRPARFDVVAVEWRGEDVGDLRHHRNAFPPEGGW